MNNKSYDYNFVNFLNNNNSLKINNEKEFMKFNRFLRKVNMINVFGKDLLWENWVQLCKINNCDYGYIIFEYNNSKGLTFSMSEKESIDWYGCYPLSINEFEV